MKVSDYYAKMFKKSDDIKNASIESVDQNVYILYTENSVVFSSVNYRGWFL